MKKITCGIYKLTSPTGKIYIGQSKNIELRKHRYEILQCKRQTKLFASLNKHGWEKHSFDVLCECDQSMLNEMEMFYIKKYKTFNTNHGLNLTSGGDHTELSVETIKKISDSNKGKKLTEKHKKQISDSKKNNKYWVGRKHSDSTKEKLRIINSNKILSDEHKHKISNACKGRIVSIETRKKQSIANTGNTSPMKGKTASIETRNKRSASLKGRVFSDETKLKMSLAKKGKTPNNKGKKMTNETKLKLHYSKLGCKGTTTGTYEIYNNNDELMYSFNENFKKKMKEYKLPIYSFIKSYQNKCKINNGKFIDWYAIKL